MNNDGLREKDNTNPIKDRIKDYASSAMQAGDKEIKEVSAEAEKSIKKALQQGKESIQHYASIVDKQVRDNPWPSVLGVAAVGLLLGFVLGTSKRGE